MATLGPAIGPVAHDGDARYINRALYAALEAFLARVRSNRDVEFVAEGELARIQRFMHAEARLLDRRDYPRWVDLLCEDFAYWVPSSYASSNLTAEVAVNFDDLRRIRDRIAYTSSGVQAAQSPPSRTVRHLSNIEAWAGAGGTLEVTASLVIHEYRRGQSNMFAGTQNTVLVPDARGYRIKYKVIELLDCDAPQGNNSFIL